MLIVVVTVASIIISIIFCWCCSKLDKEILEGLSIFSTLLSVIALLSEIAIIICMRLPQERQAIEYKERYDALVLSMRIENLMLSSDTIKELYTYNTEIKLQRKYLNSSWTNWFASPTIAQQPIIDYNSKEKYLILS